MPICKKCETKFPNRYAINGKIRNLQKRKYCIKCSPFGVHNTRQIHRGSDITRICARCKIEKNKSQFYKRGKTGSASYCKQCSKEVSQIARIKRKSAIFQHAGSKCQICGYDKCTDALDFHHKDPSKKDFQISAMGNRSIKIILKKHF